MPQLRPTHVVVLILILDREGNFTHGAQLANFPLFVGGIVAVCLISAYYILRYFGVPSTISLQNIDGANAIGGQVQYCNSNELAIKTIALMP